MDNIQNIITTGRLPKNENADNKLLDLYNLIQYIITMGLLQKNENVNNKLLDLYNLIQDIITTGRLPKNENVNNKLLDLYNLIQKDRESMDRLIQALSEKFPQPFLDEWGAEKPKNIHKEEKKYKAEYIVKLDSSEKLGFLTPTDWFENKANIPKIENQNKNLCEKNEKSDEQGKKSLNLNMDMLIQELSAECQQSFLDERAEKPENIHKEEKKYKAEDIVQSDSSEKLEFTNLIDRFGNNADIPKTANQNKKLCGKNEKSHEQGKKSLLNENINEDEKKNNTNENISDKKPGKKPLIEQIKKVNQLRKTLGTHPKSESNEIQNEKNN